MTFLEGVQRLHAESGLGGSPPASVLLQTGITLKLVNWYLDAYKDIQNHRPNWKFRQTEFSFSTVASQQNYTSAHHLITDLSSWKTDDVTCYLLAADEQELVFLPWDDFRANYKYGSFRTQTGRPIVFSVKPDMSMDLWPLPDDVYTVSGEYFKTAQTLTANTSEPVIPSDFQMIIVWRALMFYAAARGDDSKYAHGQNEFKRLMTRLEMNQLPQPYFGAPLA